MPSRDFLHLNLTRQLCNIVAHLSIIDTIIFSSTIDLIFFLHSIFVLVINQINIPLYIVSHLFKPLIYCKGENLLERKK